MMKPLAFALVCTALLAACNTNGDTAASPMPTDTIQEAGAEADPDVMAVQSAFPQVYAYLQQQDSSFTPDDFLPSGETAIQPAPATPIDEVQLEPFRPYLIYNPDRSRALDLYSYNYIVVGREGSRKLEEGSPDSEAALLDFNARTRRRLFFGGPSFALWDGKWLDENTLLMIGAETSTAAKQVPAIWKINLNDTVMQVYSYQGSVRANMEAYQKSKLAKTP